MYGHCFRMKDLNLLLEKITQPGIDDLSKLLALIDILVRMPKLTCKIYNENLFESLLTLQGIYGSDFRSCRFLIV